VLIKPNVWAIENGLPWAPDAIFREDDCRVRKGHVSQHFSAIRKQALALLRTDQTDPKREPCPV
jgi:predicted transposase YbfD/YdcC